MVGMLKTFVMDVVRNEVDLTAKESPRTATDINKLIDENIEMRKQIAELTACRQGEGCYPYLGQASQRVTATQVGRS